MLSIIKHALLKPRQSRLIMMKRYFSTSVRSMLNESNAANAMKALRTLIYNSLISNMLVRVCLRSPAAKSFVEILLVFSFCCKILKLTNLSKERPRAAKEAIFTDNAEVPKKLYVSLQQKGSNLDQQTWRQASSHTARIFIFPAL